jgi:hypothetical protein
LHGDPERNHDDRALVNTRNGKQRRKSGPEIAGGHAEGQNTRRRALGFRAKEFEVAGNEDLAASEAKMRKATELIRESEAQMDAELHRIDRYAIPEEQKQELRETIFERQRERIQAQRETEVEELLQPGLKQARQYDMSLKTVIEIVLNYFD